MKQKIYSEVYNLSIWNYGKKKPENYDELVIPEIEKKARGLNELGKNIIYNRLVSYYNKGITSGEIETLFIYNSKGATKKVFFDIKPNKISLTIKEEV